MIGRDYTHHGEEGGSGSDHSTRLLHNARSQAPASYATTAVQIILVKRSDRLLPYVQPASLEPSVPLLPAITCAPSTFDHSTSE